MVLHLVHLAEFLALLLRDKACLLINLACWNLRLLGGEVMVLEFLSFRLVVLCLELIVELDYLIGVRDNYLLLFLISNDWLDATCDSKEGLVSGISGLLFKLNLLLLLLILCLLLEEVGLDLVDVHLDGLLLLHQAVGSLLILFVLSLISDLTLQHSNLVQLVLNV